MDRSEENSGTAHKGASGKSGAPYNIVHPLRLMFGIEGMDAKTVAVLHDVVKDAKLRIAGDCKSWKRKVFLPTSKPLIV